MANRYSEEERAEAVKLAEEIGVAAASERLGISGDTIYGWRYRVKNKNIVLDSSGQPMSEAELRAENVRLAQELRQTKEEVEILQEALGFFVKRRKR